jgi:hypothetical protein
VSASGVVVESRDDGKIVVAPTALESGHDDTCEGGGGGELEVFVFGHGEGELEIFEHVFEGESGFEVTGDHAGEFHIEDARAGGIVLHGGGEFVEIDSMAIEEGEGFGEGGDGVGGDEVGGNLESGGLADCADFEDLFGGDLKLGGRALDGLWIASDVVDELSAPGGVATAGEGGVEKGGVCFVDDCGGFAGLGGRDGGVVEDDVCGGEGGSHGPHDGEEGFAV